MDNDKIKSWLEVSLTVDDEMAEAVAEVLSRYCENGVVVERGMDYNDAEDIGTPFGPCHVYGYVPMDEETEEKKDLIQQGLWHLGFIQEIPEAEYKIIEDQDWMTAWKKFYHPILIGEKLLILPAWVEQNDPDRIAVKIDPSMAFGTGTHPTTQLCLVLAEEYVKPGIDVIDVGCGSGILSIGSVLLGAKHALGVDIDPESMKNSLDNAARNGVLDRCEFYHGSVADILADKTGIKHAPLVLANILAPILLMLFEVGMADLVEPGGIICLSGILEDQEEKVRKMAESKGLTFIKRMQVKDWVA
ncbi:MAG: 50S ribosomal protein L11 methyltransferase, partial [Anaerolineaceae bacterium]|nr:50S ribosomal protein L11 methyltransferase [Anaerolineaceae bacterium]